jgi:gamma-glutamylcyclotransferase (GGCT)/AIG2-like uncharacterized protein YtfP
MIDTDLYVAYGMNTNRAGMAQRCPNAISLGAVTVPHYRFRFAYHADVVPDATSRVHGVLWQVTPQCMESLDLLEGYPTYYTRTVVPVQWKDRMMRAWIYTMQPGKKDAHPPQHYWDCLVEGYQEHGVSHTQMIRAYHGIPTA